MKHIERIDEGLRAGKNWNEIGINATLGYAYVYSYESGNDLPNFADVIWDYEIPMIVEQMKELGIHEFTISSNFSGLIATIVKFEEHGCTLEGTVKIEDRYGCNGQALPAIKMRL